MSKEELGKFLNAVLESEAKIHSFSINTFEGAVVYEMEGGSMRLKGHYFSQRFHDMLLSLGMKPEDMEYMDTSWD